MADYSNVSFKNNGKLKLLIIVGTRPEIIRLAAVITKCRKYFDTILAHTGQNYDYNLNGVFFHDLELADPEVYMNAVGADLGETMGNIIAESYKLMAAIKPDGGCAAPYPDGRNRQRSFPDAERCISDHWAAGAHGAAFGHFRHWAAAGLRLGGHGACAAQLL